MQRNKNETSKPYPGIDLGRAYQYLLRLKNTSLAQPLKTADIMQAIGYSQRGGRVSRVLGAFRQFGFARFDGTFYTFTDLGKNLLTTGSTSAADKTYALQAARSPKLYDLVYSRTNGQRDIKLSDEVANIMASYGIGRSDMRDILKNYNETLRFIDQGVTFELQTPTTTLESKKVQTGTSENTVLIDLSNGLAIEVPKDLILKAALDDLAKNGPSSKVKPHF